MTLLPSTHWIAAMAFDRMLYCLAEGIALATVVGLALRLAPQRNSRTRFTVWFATLAAVVLLPVIQFGIEMGSGSGAVLRPFGSSHPLVTLSSRWAEYFLLGWAVLAGVGLLRVAVGLVQIRRLRRGCVAIDQRLLGPELQARIEDFNKRRTISVLVSTSLEVPTAVGFFRPAILIPSWLADSRQVEELKHVLLHELAHLQRWDDWTNLAQKLVKALLFFHPGVWWIERELSLDREMACDDAVLAQVNNPRVYALCLARVAERGFLRRHMALAQAAVDRVRQLTQRVTRILDGNQPRSTRLWKPALPMVGAFAVLCAISTSSTPDLVTLSDNHSVVVASKPNPRNTGIDRVVNRASAVTPDRSLEPLVHMAKFDTASPAPQARIKASPVHLRSQTAHRVLVPAVATRAEERKEAEFSGAMKPSTEFDRAAVRAANFLANDEVATDRKSQGQQYGVVLLVMTSERISSTGSVAWQVNMWEVRLAAPASHPTKPIPSKT